MTMTSSGDAGQREVKDMRNIWERIHRELTDDQDVNQLHVAISLFSKPLT